MIHYFLAEPSSTGWHLRKPWSSSALPCDREGNRGQRNYVCEPERVAASGLQSMFLVHVLPLHHSHQPEFWTPSKAYGEHGPQTVSGNFRLKGNKTNQNPCQLHKSHTHEGWRVYSSLEQETLIKCFQELGEMHVAPRTGQPSQIEPRQGHAEHDSFPEPGWEKGLVWGTGKDHGLRNTQQEWSGFDS